MEAETQGILSPQRGLMRALSLAYSINYTLRRLCLQFPRERYSTVDTLDGSLLSLYFIHFAPTANLKRVRNDCDLDEWRTLRTTTDVDRSLVCNLNPSHHHVQQTR
jgi:hypothetical protein